MTVQRELNLRGLQEKMTESAICILLGKRLNGRMEVNLISKYFHSIGLWGDPFFSHIRHKTFLFTGTNKKKKHPIKMQFGKLSNKSLHFLQKKCYFYYLKQETVVEFK